MMITGKTKTLGVIGCPIEHSLSPAMQNAAIAKAGIDYVYIPWRVEPENLAAAVNGLKSVGAVGFNVTIPHKENIIPLLDEISEEARAVGAVNTIHNIGGKLKGYNTDAAGFLAGLIKNNILLQGKKIALLGAGGAARAVLYAVLKSGAAEIAIGVRTPSKAEALIKSLRQYAGMVQMTAYDWVSEAFARCLEETELLVQTTPLGMHPQIDLAPPINLSNLAQGAAVYDIIYTPERTKLLSEAEQYGHLAINGEAMLVGQGAAALNIWTGIRPDEAVMGEALRRELRKAAH